MSKEVSSVVRFWASVVTLYLILGSHLFVKDLSDVMVYIAPAPWIIMGIDFKKKFTLFTKP